MTFIGRWRGETWQALLSRERYGLHFSVSAQGRDPDAAEIERAMRGRPELRELVEVTEAHRVLGAVNPYVRHFVPAEQARRMFTKATTGQ
jgi:hypothetical protein